MKARHEPFHRVRAQVAAVLRILSKAEGTKSVMLARIPEARGAHQYRDLCRADHWHRALWPMVAGDAERRFTFRARPALPWPGLRAGDLDLVVPQVAWDWELQVLHQLLHDGVAPRMHHQAGLLVLGRGLQVDNHQLAPCTAALKASHDPIDRLFSQPQVLTGRRTLAVLSMSSGSRSLEC